MNVQITQTKKLDIKYVESKINQIVDGSNLTKNIADKAIALFNELAKVVYRKDKYPITTEKLAKIFDVSESSIKRLYRVLKCLGLLQITQVKSSNGSKFLTTFILSPNYNEVFAAEILKEVSHNIKMYDNGRDVTITPNVIMSLHKEYFYLSLGDFIEERFNLLETKIKESIIENNSKGFYLVEDKRLKLLKKKLNELKMNLLSLSHNLLYSIKYVDIFCGFGEYIISQNILFKNISETISVIKEFSKKQIEELTIKLHQDIAIDSLYLRLNTLSEGTDIISTELTSIRTKRKNDSDFEIEKD